jgi:acyl carrier protein
VRSIKDEVRAYVVDSFLMRKKAERLQDDTSFLAQGILDSTGVVELVSFLEETYGIQVADEEMVPENLDSLSAIEAYVQRKRGSAPSPKSPP